MDHTEQAKIPLTKGQLSLWAGHKLHPETPLHNTAYSFDISGLVDSDIFVEAFQLLVDKVDALRTVFVEHDGIPYQKVLPKVNHRLEVVDFEFDVDEDRVKEWLVKRSQFTLDVSQQVFDSVLVRIGSERCIWLLNMHHLVTDAVSMVIVYDLMVQLYRKVLDDSDEVIEKTPAFKAYQQSEEEKLSSGENAKFEEHWLNKIDRLEEIPKFYGVRNKNIGTQSRRVRLPLGQERSERLKSLIERPDVRSWSKHLSLFNIFTTVLFSYLHRVSGQKRLAIGSPVHNRTSKSFQRTVGYFVEVFPLVAEVSDVDTFKTLLQRIKIESNEYLKNARPGLTIPKISRSFNAVFNYINVGFSNFNGLPTHTEWLDPGHMDNTHHLRCHVLDFDQTGELTLLFDLNHDIFDDERIKKVPQHFLNLFDALIDDINLSIGQPQITGMEEQSQILANASGHTDEFPSVLDQFKHQLSISSDKNAVRYKAENYSYREVEQKSNDLAVFLKEKGVERGNRVALYLDRSPDYVISVLAVLKVGATFIPIASDQPMQRLSFILEDSNSTLLITNSRLQKNRPSNSVPFLNLDAERSAWAVSRQIKHMVPPNTGLDDTAYMIYTSGSTGNPKGVLISHRAMANYLGWARNYYDGGDVGLTFPLFTSIGFDLTITSTFLPLLSGGEVVIYKESLQGPDISLLEVLEDNQIDSIKLTPSHLALVQDMDMSRSRIRTMIVGGEDFKTRLATTVQDAFGTSLQIYNEYGPTEATVGCLAGQFEPKFHDGISVPIGKPIANMKAYVLDGYRHIVPVGVVGELYLSGRGLADGYANLEETNRSKFVDNPFNEGEKMYRTGDLARMNDHGEWEYLGRVDDQVKFKGYRIELPDIETNLLELNVVENAAVVLVENGSDTSVQDVSNCAECGLPSNYPNTDFDEEGVCHLCNAFKGYKDKARRYFKTEDQLKEVLMTRRGQSPNYDCLSLLSGGKDSTYILARLVGMGLRVLAFTLDNGYISEQAKDNIDRIVKKLGVDHIYGETPHMNKIFVDSLNRHQNVCNGCFKTIYTLSTKVALEKEIPFVITGLSRGQFFETRLTEELFWDDTAEVSTIDDTILEARKLYHQEEDAVKNLLDVSMFQKEATFKKVQFVDFYRYSDVRLEEMLKYLKETVGWVRPTDTGRSTNCLINQVGIYVHKKQKGYSNYSFPYSWDVRMGHKTRKETLDEINEVIDEKEVKRIMGEIGYQERTIADKEQQRLVGYYTGKQKVPTKVLSDHLKTKLPDYMVPSHFKFMERLPLTANGKVDKLALKALNSSQLEMDTPFVAPNGEIEELLAETWKEVLRLEQVGVHDDFIALGGHSLAAIRVTARINEEVEMNFPLSKIFEHPTIAEYAKFIEETLIELLQENE